MKNLFFIIVFMAGFFFASLSAADIPTFPGGEEALKKYISTHTTYPENARENSVEGIITVGFIVLPDGSLTEIKVVKLIDPDLEREAIKVVSNMPAWIPAEKDGTPIEAPSQVEIPFLLDE